VGERFRKSLYSKLLKNSIYTPTGGTCKALCNKELRKAFAMDYKRGGVLVLKRRYHSEETGPLSLLA
jgi:hypothetical protein